VKIKMLPAQEPKDIKSHGTQRLPSTGNKQQGTGCSPVCSAGGPTPALAPKELCSGSNKPSPWIRTTLEAACPPGTATLR